MSTSNKEKMNGNIVELTRKNNNYRNVLHTEKNFQLILQSLILSEDVPEETHDDTVQFICCVYGSGVITIEDERIVLKENIFCIVPIGKKHYIKPTSDVFKFYTIYNSIEHDPKVIEKRQPIKYTVGDKYVLSKSKTTQSWSFYNKDEETKLCEHEFKDIKKLAKEINTEYPCPICVRFIQYSKDQ